MIIRFLKFSIIGALGLFLVMQIATKFLGFISGYLFLPLMYLLVDCYASKLKVTNKQKFLLTSLHYFSIILLFNLFNRLFTDSNMSGFGDYRILLIHVGLALLFSTIVMYISLSKKLFGTKRN